MPQSTRGSLLDSCSIPIYDIKHGTRLTRQAVSMIPVAMTNFQ